MEHIWQAQQRKWKSSRAPIFMERTVKKADFVSTLLHLQIEQLKFILLAHRQPSPHPASGETSMNK